MFVIYTGPVRKSWSDTIEAHRRAVRTATLETTAALVAEHGLASVTMSQIAEETGIGRATLYKYFSDVQSILLAWHERQIAEHLDTLANVRDRVHEPIKCIDAVFEAFALMAYRRHSAELPAFLHHAGHVARTQRELAAFIAGLIAEAASTGDLRNDVAAEELAEYCVHALSAAGTLESPAAVRRLVRVTVAGLRPEPTADQR